MLSLPLQTGHGQGDPPSLLKSYKGGMILQESTLSLMLLTLPCPTMVEQNRGLLATKKASCWNAPFGF